MITASNQLEKYQQFITSLGQKYSPPVGNVRLPIDEKLYHINWDTRVVEAPSHFGVEGDHEAEYIFFEMDRFVDSVDLANCIGIVQFKNANGEEYYQLLTAYDTVSKPRKIIFGWDIQGAITKYSGNVYFSFKFFKIAAGELVYEINTIPVKSKVYSGWLSKDGYSHDYSQMSADKFLIDSDWIINIEEIVNASKNFQVFWLDM